MPPAFALSQDQTLRFIKTRRPKVTQPDEHRPYSLIKSAQATRPGQTTRSVCSSSKRYINKHPNHPSKRVTKPNYTQTTNRHALSGTTSGRRQRIPSRPYIIVKEQPVSGLAAEIFRSARRREALSSRVPRACQRHYSPPGRKPKIPGFPRKTHKIPPKHPARDSRTTTKSWTTAGLCVDRITQLDPIPKSG